MSASALTVPCTWCGAPTGQACKGRATCRQREEWSARTTRSIDDNPLVTKAIAALEELGLEVSSTRYTSPAVGALVDDVVITVRVKRPLPDFYGAGARAAGLDVTRVLHNRNPDAVSARWGVWLGLRDAGWSYSRIGKRSTSAKTWCHTTVRAALLRLEKERWHLEHGPTHLARIAVGALLTRDSHADVTDSHAPVTEAA